LGDRRADLLRRQRLGGTRKPQAADMSDGAEWIQQQILEEQQQLETENPNEQPSTARLFGDLPCDL
jgi:hypothetical protein